MRTIGRILRNILFGLTAVVMLLGVAVLICAFNPSLTESLTAKVNGTSSEADNDRRGTTSGTVGNTSVGTQGNIGTVSGQIIGEEYVAPEQGDIASPESVRDRNGYEPIQDTKEQIGDEDAANLQKELQTGNTGADISFDVQLYPYYGMLDQDMQALYRQIYANAIDLNVSFAPVVAVKVDQVKNVFEAVYNDHPELFWLETEYSCKYLRGGQCIELTLQYYSVVDDLEAAREEFDRAAEDILSGARGLSNDYEKEKYIHDVLVERVEYKAGSVMDQSAYSALVNGESVCAGYARAFQYLMMELGVPCYYCTGYSGQDHAWNIIKLDNGYYNVDVTWDDTEPSTYDYFNRTDTDYMQTHMRTSMSVYLPACISSVYRGADADGSRRRTDQKVGSEGSVSETEEPDESDSTSLTGGNPQKPLTWNSGNSDTAESGDLDTLEKYYKDCLEQMTDVGTGQQEFINDIPEELWSSVEWAYSNGNYQSGYVNDALKQMGVKNFTIQLQAERLGNGYYRLYHNISTW